MENGLLGVALALGLINTVVLLMAAYKFGRHGEQVKKLERDVNNLKDRLYK
jgi:hypothetical protein